MCQGQLQIIPVRALHALFHVLQEAASTAAAEAQSRLQAAEEAAQAADTAATEAANLAAAKAQEEYGNLRRVLDAVNAQKADLEGKLAKAGGALNAAEELKEARYAAALAASFEWPALSSEACVKTSGACSCVFTLANPRSSISHQQTLLLTAKTRPHVVGRPEVYAPDLSIRVM